MDIALSSRLATNTMNPKGQVDSLESEVPSAGHNDASREVSKAKFISEETIEQALSGIKDFVQSIRRDLSFDLDDSSGEMIVKVTDRASGEVVRQIPSEEALRLAENLEEARSLLFTAEA